MKQSPKTNGKTEVVFDWEEFVDNNDWDKVVDWWETSYYFTDPGNTTALEALLARIQEIVPKITVRNGTEVLERWLEPGDPPERWKGYECLRGAAQILSMGELEAAILSAIPTPLEEWDEFRGAAKAELEQLRGEPEPTEGDESLSRVAHVNEAFLSFEKMEFAERFLLHGATDDDEERVLKETAAELAHCAFLAGLHCQIALGKSNEALAATKKRMAANVVGNTFKNYEKKQNAALWRREVTRIAQNLSDNLSVSNKAKIVRTKLMASSELEEAVVRVPAVGTIRNFLGKN
ncbi:hypothetical protein [Planktotalea arctica]|uniref:hypothetical protein n=1 Tax=Planktotalea arctica TaxID=1481893 RepID=UPI00321C3670